MSGFRVIITGYHRSVIANWYYYHEIFDTVIDLLTHRSQLVEKAELGCAT